MKKLRKYAANGNMTANNAADYFEYDDENRLIMAAIYATNITTEFQYDGLGQTAPPHGGVSGLFGPMSSVRSNGYIYDGKLVPQERTCNFQPANLQPPVRQLYARQ